MSLYCLFMKLKVHIFSTSSLNELILFIYFFSSVKHTKPLSDMGVVNSRQSWDTNVSIANELTCNYRWNRAMINNFFWANNNITFIDVGKDCTIFEDILGNTL